MNLASVGVLKELNNWPVHIQLKQINWQFLFIIGITTKYIYTCPRVAQVCPLVRIGTPPLPSPASMCSLSRGQRGDTLVFGWGVGGSQFWRLEKKPVILSGLWENFLKKRRHLFISMFSNNLYFILGGNQGGTTRMLAQIWRWWRLWGTLHLNRQWHKIFTLKITGILLLYWLSGFPVSFFKTSLTQRCLCC